MFSKTARYRRRLISGALLLAMVLFAASGSAASDQDPRYQAVQAMGRLNGIALQCRYLDQVRRMKTAVVANAPKERSFGLAFDEATNGSFLDFIKTRAACPEPAGFGRRVGDGIDALKAVFAGE